MQKDRELKTAHEFVDSNLLGSEIKCVVKWLYEPPVYSFTRS